MSLQDSFRTNLKAFQIYSKLNIFPVEFTKHGKAKSFENGSKRIAFYCLFLNAILYTLYLYLRFLQAITAEKTSIIQLALHGLVATVAAMSLYWQAQFFFWMEAFTNMVLNELLAISSCILSSKEGMHELLIKVVPFMVLEWTFIPLIPYVLEPDSPQTVYSGLSSFFQKTPLSMIASMLYEYFTFSFLVLTFNYSIFLQLGILLSTWRELDSGVKELRRNLMPGRLAQHIKKCQRIQLRMAYFNKVFSTSIYAVKLEILADSTFGIFFAIKIRETHPFLAAFFAAVSVIDLVCYSAVYSKGFEIPSLMDEYTKGIMLQTARRSDAAECMEVRKMVRSVPKVAVVVGEFGQLERSSTADMGDFIVNNVVSLLVSYPESIVF